MPDNSVSWPNGAAPFGSGNGRPTISIVSTLYGSQAHVDEFVSRAAAAASDIFGDDFLIVLVNDGSPDGSLDRARELVRKHAYVRLVDLSRNFGHHKAIMTGLAYAPGELVFLIDSDLEEPPECLHTLWEAMRREKCDVAFGVQERRKGGFVERVGGSIFWKLINRISSANITANPLTARLMTRRYVDSLLLHREGEIFLAGLFHITGYDQVSVSVAKSHRGSTTYNVAKRVRLFVNAVTSFSNAPLVWIFYIGVTISLTSVASALWLAIRRLAFGTIVEGWTSVIISVWLLGGLMISFIGVIGIYLSKIFSEVKGRPYTIVRHIYEHGDE